MFFLLIPISIILTEIIGFLSLQLVCESVLYLDLWFVFFWSIPFSLISLCVGWLFTTKKRGLNCLSWTFLSLCVLGDLIYFKSFLLFLVVPGLLVGMIGKLISLKKTTNA